jgi:CheY-like chemotaxis protein
VGAAEFRAGPVPRAGGAFPDPSLYAAAGGGPPDRRRLQVQAITAARLGKVPRKAILIVHNHPGVCFALKRKLQELGYHVLVAADGSGGLRCLSQDKPDLALVQFDMSGMNGLEFLKKSFRKGRKTKMIVIAKKKELSLIQKERIPIDGHLGEPFDLEDLLDQIQKLIGEPT